MSNRQPTQHNDGGPAFPTESEHPSGHNIYHFQGMSLRDYFAAAALQGISYKFTDCGYTAAEVAGEAYGLADAMLAEREKKVGAE